MKIIIQIGIAGGAIMLAIKYAGGAVNDAGARIPEALRAPVAVMVAGAAAIGAAMVARRVTA